jgi:hypothetical protein
VKNLTINVLTILFFVLSGANAFAVAAKVDADIMNPCVADAGIAPGIISQSPASSTCGATPQEYQVIMYEMGVCTSHPYGATKNSETFDTSSCTVVYSDTAPVATDLAATIGSALNMPGESTLPPVGTYGFPYVYMSNVFKTKTTFTAGDGSLWYGLANGVADQTGPAALRTDTLANFGDTTCFSGYLDAVVSGGTIDGFITDANKGRSAAGTADPCVKRGRLVGVMNLTAPFTITPQTFGLNFQFRLTGQGTQFMKGSGANVVTPDRYGSAPFSGVFTVLNQD